MKTLIRTWIIIIIIRIVIVYYAEAAHKILKHKIKEYDTNYTSIHMQPHTVKNTLNIQTLSNVRSRLPPSKSTRLFLVQRPFPNNLVKVHLHLCENLYAIFEHSRKTIYKEPHKNKKAVLSQKWPRNAPYIWVAWTFSGLPWLRPRSLFPTLPWAFVPIDPMNF